METQEETGAPAGAGAGVLARVRGLLAGPIAGVCSRLVTYPPDTIKARLQVQGAAPGGGPALYRGAWDAVLQVSRTEGLRGFYRGFGAVALGSVPANMAYFGAYEAAKAVVPARWGMLGDMSVGAAAQLVAGLVFTPVDIVKERLQVAPLMRSAYAYTGPLQAARELVQRNGPLGLLKGYWATNAVWLPWNTLFIACYAASKRAAAAATLAAEPSALSRAGGASQGEAEGQAALRQKQQRQTHEGDTPSAADGLSPLVLGLCSAGSASLAGLLTHPADVVKTRLQVLSACEAHARTTAWALARQMWASEGPRVFLVGVGPRILQLAPVTAVSWAIYEPIQRILAPAPAPA